VCGHGRIGGRTCGALYDALTSRARTLTSLKPYRLHDGGLLGRRPTDRAKTQKQGRLRKHALLTLSKRGDSVNYTLSSRP